MVVFTPNTSELYCRNQALALIDFGTTASASVIVIYALMGGSGALTIEVQCDQAPIFQVRTISESVLSIKRDKLSLPYGNR